MFRNIVQVRFQRCYIGWTAVPFAMTHFVVAACALAVGYGLGFVSHPFAKLHVVILVFSCALFTMAPYDGAKVLCEFARVFFRIAPDGCKTNPGRRVCLKVGEC